MSERRTQLESQLSAYLDDELTPEQRAEVEAFLAADAGARALLAELRAVSSALHALPRARAKADIMEGVRVRMERRALLGESEHQPRKAVGSISATGRWTAAAAIVLMTGVAGYVTWILNAGDKPPAALTRRMALVDKPHEPIASPEGKRQKDQFETTGVTSNSARKQAAMPAEPQALASATHRKSGITNDEGATQPDAIMEAVAPDDKNKHSDRILEGVQAGAATTANDLAVAAKPAQQGGDAVRGVAGQQDLSYSYYSHANGRPASAGRLNYGEPSTSTVLLIACADDTGRKAVLDAIATNHQFVKTRQLHEQPASPARQSDTAGAANYKFETGGELDTDVRLKRDRAGLAKPSAQAPAASTQEQTKAIEALKEHEEKARSAPSSGVADVQQPTNAKVTDVEVVVASEHARDELIRQLSREWSAKSGRAEGLSRDVDEVGSAKSKSVNFSADDKLWALTTSQSTLDYNEHQVGQAGKGNDLFAKVPRSETPQTRPADGYWEHKPADDHDTADVAGSRPDTAAAKPQAFTGIGVRPNVAVNAESSTRPASDGIAVESDGDGTGGWTGGWAVNGNDGDKDQRLGESTATASAAPALATDQADSAPAAAPAQPAAASAPPLTAAAKPVTALTQPVTACFVRLHIRVATPTTTQPTAAPPASAPATTTQPHQ